MSEVKAEPAPTAETHVKGETIVSHSVLEETTVITETLEIERENTHQEPVVHKESEVEVPAAAATGNAEALSQLQDPVKDQETNANVVSSAMSTTTEPAPVAPIDHTLVVAATTSEAPVDDTTTMEDTNALIASLRNQVAVLTAKNADLEARLALAEQSARANAQPKLVHPAKSRPNPRRTNATAATANPSTDYKENEKDTQLDSDAKDTITDPTQETTTEPVSEESQFKKKINTMGGVSMFGGAAPGFNPFAGGGSPTAIHLKARSSVADSSNDTDAKEAVAKLDEVREWMAGILSDESIKTDSVVFGAELLKDGSVLCRLVSALFPSNPAKFKPGKFIFIHKENIGNFQKSCAAVGVTPTFEYDDLLDEKRVGYVLLQLLNLKQKSEAQ
ncbi:hypothetical protein BJ741DRAFT_600614 [Chytriomyces cf. hyalinus JEL632]|nr:hypothetical protein BJ741DRAFT_600614 [Chytriomyces cf. hyalinus JEL632]